MSTERDTTHTDEEFREPDARPETRIGHAEVHSGSGGGLLIGTGAMLLLLATGLVLVPSVSPGQAWIVSSLAQRGVTSFPVYAAGLFLSGLWLVVRMSRAHSVAAQRAALSNGPRIEDVAGEISLLRDGIQALRIEFVYLKDVVQSHVENAGTSASSDSQADAMYRLAASLDQLGQRVEEQIRSSQLEVRETLEDLSSAVEVARLEGRDGRIHLGHEVDRHAEPVAEPNGSDGALYRLEGGTPEVISTRDEGETRERLGVLDLLDDLGRLLPRKTSPDMGHPVITSDAFEGVQDEGWGLQEAPAGPLPAPRRKDQIDVRKAGLLASELGQSPDDLTVVTKLEELRALLADARVRRALTTMDRLE